ncbi:hypothetical protein D3C84_253340 [compost metagenome]
MTPPLKSPNGAGTRRCVKCEKRCWSMLSTFGVQTLFPPDFNFPSRSKPDSTWNQNVDLTQIPVWGWRLV